MRISDVELVPLLTVPRADIAIFGMIVVDVQLVLLAGLHIRFVHDGSSFGVLESAMHGCSREPENLTLLAVFLTRESDTAEIAPFATAWRRSASGRGGLRAEPGVGWVA